MGDENEIEIVQKDEGEPKDEGVSVFLPEVIHDPEGKVREYSLSEEFAKTGKNRSLGLYAAVIGFIAFLAAGAVLVTLYIQGRFDKEPININTFEDIRLIDVLDKAKRLEGDLNRARVELNDLELAKRDAILAAKSPEAKRQVEARYRERIAQKRRVVAEKQRELDSHDARLQESIKKAEAIVSNYQRLHKIEMDRQRDYYADRIASIILKYNPRFTSKELKRILSEKAEPLGGAGYESRSEMRKIINDLSLLEKRMLEIPYINSVGPAVERIDYLSKRLIRDYERKTSQLSHLNQAFDHLLKTDPESGYVLDARDTGNIAIYMKTLPGPREGDISFVFRQDDEYIGRIRLFKTAEGLKGQVLELEPGKKIQPFDRILIKLKQE